MSRYTDLAFLEPVLRAAERWRDEALIGDNSVFTNRTLWSLENLRLLEEYYVNNPDDGEGTYYDKLEGQLRDASSEIKQLAAEMMWVMMLAPSNITAKTKLNSVRTIWEWSQVEFPQDSELLTNEVLVGIGSGGVGYNTNSWREFVFFIRMMLLFK